MPKGDGKPCGVFFSMKQLYTRKPELTTCFFAPYLPETGIKTHQMAAICFENVEIAMQIGSFGIYKLKSLAFFKTIGQNAQKITIVFYFSNA